MTSLCGKVVYARNAASGTPHYNLLNLSMVKDGSGIIDLDLVVPGVVPDDATGLILTVERGWLAIPPGGTGCVSLRVMPDGYDLGNVLDRAKNQAWIVNGMGVDVVADDVLMPISQGHRRFFWALQSSHPEEQKKMAIIDLWGWTVG